MLLDAAGRGHLLQVVDLVVSHVLRDHVQRGLWARRSLVTASHTSELVLLHAF